MRALVRFLLAAGLSLSAALALASPASPKEGTDYLKLKSAVPAEAGKKVEVIEFFGYFCNHCYSLEKSLASWAVKNRDKVAFKRVHVRFGDNMILVQRLFFTLTDMGKLTDELHERIFEAIQVKRTRLRNEKQIADFVETLGINRTAFIEAYRSDKVRKLTENASLLQDKYDIHGVPTIAIDGRYVTSLGIVAEGNQLVNVTEAEAQRLLLQVMDGLVAQVLKEKAGKSPKARATSK